MADAETITRLRGVPMFAGLPADAFEFLAAKVSEFDAPAGRVLIQPNQAGSGLLVLTSGRATVELRSGAIECGPGECFGELSMLVENLVHTARVRAATDVEGIAISRHEFEELLNSDGRIALALLRVLAKRLVDTDELLTPVR